MTNDAPSPSFPLASLHERLGASIARANIVVLQGHVIGSGFGAGLVAKAEAQAYPLVMPGLVPGIHVLIIHLTREGVDGRDKPAMAGRWVNARDVAPALP